MIHHSGKIFPSRHSAKQQKASLYTALRLASPNLKSNKLVLSFRFPLHLKKIAQPTNINTLEKVIYEISGTQLAVECSLTDAEESGKVLPQSNNKTESDLADLETISNIFGSAEVLES